MSPRRLRRKVAKARCALYAYTHTRGEHKLDMTAGHAFVHKVVRTSLRLIDTPAYDPLFPVRSKEPCNDNAAQLEDLFLELWALEGALFLCMLAVVKQLSGYRLTESEAWCLVAQALRTAVENKKMPVSTDIRQEAERELSELVDLVAEFFNEKQSETSKTKVPIKITDIKPEKNYNGIRTDTDGENP